MILADLFSIVLRLAELAFAAIVAGLTGVYLDASKGASSWSLGRHIYTVVVAGLSIIFAIIWLFPFSGSFIHWPTDFVISVMWFVAFGLLVDWLDGACGYASPHPLSPASKDIDNAMQKRLQLGGHHHQRPKQLLAAQGQHRLCVPQRHRLAR
jgi:hypothetical protein